MSLAFIGKISVVTFGFILWVLLVIAYKLRTKRLPTLRTTLFFFVECQGLILGPVICLGSFIGWPKFSYEEFKWVIGLGGIAVFWIAFEQVRAEFIGTAFNNKLQIKD